MLKSLYGRAKLLATGKVEIIDNATGKVTVERWRRGAIWILVRPDSGRWRWVRRHGALECGCTRNPVTRRMVSYRGGCETHCPTLARSLRDRREQRERGEPL